MVFLYIKWANLNCRTRVEGHFRSFLPSQSFRSKYDFPICIQNHSSTSNFARCSGAWGRLYPLQRARRRWITTCFCCWTVLFRHDVAILCQNSTLFFDRRVQENSVQGKILPTHIQFRSTLRPNNLNIGDNIRLRKNRSSSGYHHGCCGGQGHGWISTSRATGRTRWSEFTSDFRVRVAQSATFTVVRCTKVFRFWGNASTVTIRVFLWAFIRKGRIFKWRRTIGTAESGRRRHYDEGRDAFDEGLPLYSCLQICVVLQKEEEHTFY